MKKTGSNKSARQPSQDRTSSSRVGRRSSPSSSSTSGRGSSSRDSGRREPEDSGRFSSDDGGYYSNRNLSGQESRDQMNYDTQSSRWDNENRSDYEEGRRSGSREWNQDDNYSDSEGLDDGQRSQYQRYSPYRAYEQDYQSGSRGDRDQFGESEANRPDATRSTRREQEDSQWGARMNGRDQEMGSRSIRQDSSSSRERENFRGDRNTRFADLDDVEGQYDEDYRDREGYRRTSRGPSANSNMNSNMNSRYSSGSRR